MSGEQPKALALADALRETIFVGIFEDELVLSAEAELRRLHECERDAMRYRYLRNRKTAEVMGKVGVEAGCWIDCEDDGCVLALLTGDDADKAIDAAIDAAKDQA